MGRRESRLRTFLGLKFVVVVVDEARHSASTCDSSSMALINPLLRVPVVPLPLADLEGSI